MWKNGARLCGRFSGGDAYRMVSTIMIVNARIKRI